mgnify:CR=1 FL=1
MKQTHVKPSGVSYYLSDEHEWLLGNSTREFTPSPYRTLPAPQTVADQLAELGLIEVGTPSPFAAEFQQHARYEPRTDDGCIRIECRDEDPLAGTRVVALAVVAMYVLMLVGVWMAAVSLTDWLFGR